MRFTIFVISGFFLFCSNVFGQNEINLLVIDSTGHTPISRVEITVQELGSTFVTKAKGLIKLSNLPNGSYHILLRHNDFSTKEITIELPLKQEIYTVILSMRPLVQQKLMVEVTKAIKAIQDIPTRTDVLTSEIEATASIEPSTINRLLGRTTGVRVQTTTASTGGKVVRIHGLGGQYTTLLRDGFPIYGGLSNSLDLLQIAPLDLRQVEYIKGSASALYGNGAIGGVINLVTKRPESNETMLHENLSTIGGRDFNAFVSKDLGKFGFTSLATLYMHRPYDADKDGYSDMPEVLKIHFSPRFFYYPTKRTEVSLGGIITDDRRMGGDMDLINHFNADSTHFYFDTQLCRRLAYQLSVRQQIGEFHMIRFKNSLSSFNRRIQVRENIAGAMMEFSGNELASYSELSYQFNKTTHNLTIGFQFNSNTFTEVQQDSASMLRNQKSEIYALYLNYLWEAHKAVFLETAIRTDYAGAQSKLSRNPGQLFLLPRFNALFKAGKEVSFRLGGGLGYRMPTLFNPESEPYGFQHIQAIDFEHVKAEQSYSGNFDLKYQSDFGTKLVAFTFNPSVFYNVIENPIQLMADSAGALSYKNNGDRVTSSGVEAQIHLTLWKFVLSAGYTYTSALFRDSSNSKMLPLTPQHCLKGDLSFLNKGKWLLSCGFDYNSEQMVSSGLKKPAYFTTRILAELTAGKFGIFGNFENVTGFRQTRSESLITNIDNTTRYAEIWAPLDGFFFTWGVKVRF